MPDTGNPPQGTAPSGAQPGVFIDPYRAYNFKLQIQGVTDGQGHFTACSGLGIKVEVIKYREGGNQVTYNIPGQVKYSDITLRYGLTSSREIWDWLMSAVEGPKQVQRKNVTIQMLDTDGVGEVMRWNLEHAWISEWCGARLDALSSEVAIESLTLVYETLHRA